MRTFIGLSFTWLPNRVRPDQVLVPLFRQKEYRFLVNITRQPQNHQISYPVGVKTAFLDAPPPSPLNPLSELLLLLLSEPSPWCTGPSQLPPL
jgi:hypothetical protein